MLRTIYLILLCCIFVQASDLPSDNSIIVFHSGFTVGYSNQHKQASWVYYTLFDRIDSKVKRSGYTFRVDPMVDIPSTYNDYYQQEYDIGHLFPAADASYDTSSMRECFYFSNTSPQKPSFNRGIWKKLENQVRYWSQQHDTLKIVTGGILTDSLTTIGNRLSVPEYFYKVILAVDSSKVSGIGFILKNDRIRDNLDSFILTVDSVESLTKINFFPNVNDSIESKVDTLMWFN